MHFKTKRPIIVVALSLAYLTSACQSELEEPSSVREAIDELQRKYDEVVADKMDDPVQWAADDIENLGDWEYRVENLSYSSTENLAEQLNDFGNDRWEVIWLERTPKGFLVVLKKPSVSLLSKVPLSGLGKIIVGGSDSEQ